MHVLAGKSALVIGARPDRAALAARCLALRARACASSDEAASGFDAERRALAGSRRVAPRRGRRDAARRRRPRRAEPGRAARRARSCARRGRRAHPDRRARSSSRSAALACPILAITGTNGKSTTTTLVGPVLARGGPAAVRRRQPRHAARRRGRARTSTARSPRCRASSSSGSSEFRPAVGVPPEPDRRPPRPPRRARRVPRREGAPLPRADGRRLRGAEPRRPWVVGSPRASPRRASSRSAATPVACGAFPVDGSVVAPPAGERRASASRWRARASRGGHNVENMLAASPWRGSRARRRGRAGGDRRDRAAAASAGSSSRERDGVALVRRLEGDQRRRGGEDARFVSRAGRPARRRRRQGRRLRRRSRARPRAGEAAGSVRRGARAASARRSAARPQTVVAADARGGGRRRRRCGAAGRHGAARAGVRELRHVPRLRRARASASARWWRRSVRRWT